jgi:hypothetical protein
MSYGPYSGGVSFGVLEAAIGHLNWSGSHLIEHQKTDAKTKIRAIPIITAIAMKFAFGESGAMYSNFGAVISTGFV